MTWTELGAGYKLLIVQVTGPCSDGPFQPEDWVWWVVDSNDNLAVEQSLLCVGVLSESAKFKAYSAAAYRLRGKVERLIRFDQLEWRAGALGL